MYMSGEAVGSSCGGEPGSLLQPTGHPRNRDQDQSHIFWWSWTTWFLEVKVFVLLSLQLGADL